MQYIFFSKYEWWLSMNDHHLYFCTLFAEYYPFTASAIALLYISFFLVGFCGVQPPSNKDFAEIRLHVAYTASVHESRCGGLTEQRLLGHLTMDNTSTE